jgi:hypothetical protein
MSKYNPLKLALQDCFGDEAPMGFAEIEQLLGFPLPPSARRSQAWWANSRGAHVQAAAWLDAGWLTSRVDLAGERVVFVREQAPRPTYAGVSEGGPAIIAIRRDALTPAAIRMIEGCAEELHIDLDAAAAFALNSAAIDRRRRLLEEFRALCPDQTSDSVDLVREDRDGR